MARRKTKRIGEEIFLSLRFAFNHIIMRTNITLEQALQKASRRLRDKMIYSVNLLKKAESLALAYGGG